MDSEPDDTDSSFKCKFCGKTFSTRKNLTHHQKTCDKFIVIPRSSTSFASPPRKPVEAFPGKISCQYCSKQFTLKKNCLRHEGTCGNNLSASTTFTCELCGSTTKRQDNHKAHIKKCQERHDKNNSEGQKQTNESFKEVEKPLKSKTPCLFDDCDEEFFHKISLIEHLKNAHKSVKILEPISKKFDSVDEFYLWKDEEQEKTYSLFTQKSGLSGSKIKYLYCQHDGTSHSKRKTSRLNLKGRVKVGHYCIAKMTVSKDEDGKINLLYFPTHSHVCSPIDFVHHPLVKKNDMYINERIGWGVSPTKILRDIHKKQILKTSTPLDIQHCKAAVITKKLIRERARKRKEKLRYHKDEATALYLMVQKLHQEDGCVVLYKPYGDNVHIGPKEIDSLPNHKDLFMIGLQTKRQAQLMADHCHKVLLVDETHGTNHHKFQLLSVLIVDDNRRGWPVGHLITSKSDADTLQYFFKALKQNAPAGVDLNLNCVITDDDAALINSMDLGFHNTLGKLRHLLCKWHLLRAFKKNLRSHVPLKMVEDMMIELRVLVNEKDKDVFSRLQSGFIAKYDNSPECKTFIDYYRKNYENRVQKWAMAFRNFPHANVNTTGHIESFHHRLKKVYLKRKVNRRLDDLINILIDLEWDDHILRVREATLGLVMQPQEILIRHKRGMALPDADLKQVDENTWDIKASSGKEFYYIVQYAEKCLAEHCFFKCTQIACGSLCTHMFSCSCKDNNPLCKHVHKLHAFLTRDIVKQVRDNENCTDATISDATIGDATFDLPLEEEKKSHSTSNDTETRKTLSKNIQELEENIAQLSGFCTSFKDNCGSLAVANAIAHASAVTKELVLQLRYMSAMSDEDGMAHMEPAVKFNSNATLKTQASQVLSFKKPPAKRKKQPEGVSPSKKQSVVKDLLSLLDGNSGVYGVSFTPPLDFVNPCDVILKCHNEKITLLNLKSLEYQMPSDEAVRCMKMDAAFHVGWLYSNIINAYMGCLGEQYPSMLPISSDLALRASRGVSNIRVLQGSLEGSTQKDVLLMPANISGNHWCIVAVILDLTPAQVWYYDPLQGKLNHATETLLSQMCADLKLLFPNSNWDTIVYVEEVKQADSFNCGIYICDFAEQMARKSRPYTISNNINALRKDIYDTIVGECLKRETYDTDKCRLCSKSFSDETDNNAWISCSKCDEWFHQSCVGPIHGGEFVCPLVRNL